MRVIFNTGSYRPKIKDIRHALFYAVEASDTDFAKTMHEKNKQKPFIYSFPYQDKNGNNKFKIATISEDFMYHLVKGIKFSKKHPVWNNLRDMRFIYTPDLSYNEKGNTKINIFTLTPIAIKVKENDKIVTVDNIQDITTEKVRTSLVLNLLKKREQFLSVSEDDKVNKTLYLTPKENVKTVIVHYKGIGTIGFVGEFELIISKDLFFIAYNLGLGAKNGMGFGMFEVANWE